MIGYDTSRSATPTGNNRPLLTLGAFYIKFSNTNGSTFRNIRFTGTANSMILGGLVSTGTVVINCKIESLSVTGTKYLFDFQAADIRNVRFVDCEFLGTAGANTTAILTNDSLYSGLFVGFCFFHDLTNGFYFDRGAFQYTDSAVCFFKNTFARMFGEAIHSVSGTGSGMTILFNSFYSSVITIDIGTKAAIVIYGNTFDGASNVAIYSNVVNKSMDIENNDFWNNLSTVFNCFLDINNIGLNPLWVNPVANDFNFGPGSPNIDQALGIRLGV
jgi:hypothetical protein